MFQNTTHEKTLNNETFVSLAHRSGTAVFIEADKLSTSVICFQFKNKITLKMKSTLTLSRF